MKVTGSVTCEPLYYVWRSMQYRCSSPKAPAYHRYGGRGITVCTEWSSSYEAFKVWAYAHGYREGLTLERKNTDGNYCPENCVWATPKAQANNRSNTVYIEFDCVTDTVSGWAERLGTSVNVVYQHYRYTGTPYSRRQLRRLNYEGN